MSNKFNLKKPTHLVATVFGSGLAPVAPGTFGTIGSIPFCVAFMYLFSPMVNLAILAAISLLGVYVCDKVSEDLGEHDHGSIVIDEFAGLMLTYMFLPEFTVIWFAIGFILFRFFDIVKPQPIKYLDQKVHNGLGIMIDDLLAGLMAGGVIILMAHYLPSL